MIIVDDKDIKEEITGNICKEEKKKKKKKGKKDKRASLSAEGIALSSTKRDISAPDHKTVQPPDDTAVPVVKKRDPHAIHHKIFILDTNIMMQTNGQALDGFDDNEVVITHTTLEELDSLKTALGERGYSAREAIRMIDSLRNKKGNYETGYPVGSGGIFRIETNNLEANLPKGWSLDKPDNRIICTAKTLTGKNPDSEVYLITNDVAMRIKASVAGVSTQGYHNEQVDTDEYTGRREIDLGDNGTDIINDLYSHGKCNWAMGVDDVPFMENEYIMLRAGNQSALARYNDGSLTVVRDKPVYKVSAKNAGQTFALDALMAPADKIPLVILIGPAGTGKTYLSMAAALEQTYGNKKERNYDNVIITRSNTLSDEDIGFLPGTLEEKMTPLLAPFYDNLKSLLKRGEDEDPAQIEMQADDLMKTGVIKIASLAYIRGRSIANSYIIIDEAQNLTVTQIKTIVTRCGLGSKIVILGDPGQIDTPKLSRKSNGLVYLSDAMKGSSLCAQVTFQEGKECVRSPLAMEAAIRL
jgi:PhoH-like ATPase